MITKRGSQSREPLNESGYVIDATWPDVDRGSIVLRDVETGKRELWHLSDDYAGYVIEIEGCGYEFGRSL